MGTHGPERGGQHRRKRVGPCGIGALAFELLRELRKGRGAYRSRGAFQAVQQGAPRGAFRRFQLGAQPFKLLNEKPKHFPCEHRVAKGLAGQMGFVQERKRSGHALPLVAPGDQV